MSMRDPGLSMYLWMNRMREKEEGEEEDEEVVVVAAAVIVVVSAVTMIE